MKSPLSTVVAMAVSIVAVSTGEAAARKGPRCALPEAQSIEAVEQLVMPEVDVVGLLAEDEADVGAAGVFRPRFASQAGVAITPDAFGTWELLVGGSRLWRLRIVSPGALSLNLGLDRFELPDGAWFLVHDAYGEQVRGPYTARDRNIDGGLWTAVVLGDELVAELHLPAGTGADVRISSVNHGYRFFGAEDAGLVDKRGPCNVNVVCPEGDLWRDQIRSVARITISGMYVCTGQLVNNTAEDERPFLLTAQHCVETPGEAPTVVAYWNYESPNCFDYAGGSLSTNQSGSTWISSWALSGGSDFTLVELDQDPDPAWNLYLTGWDARGQTPASTTTVHHPSGDEKSISFDYDPPTSTSYLGSSPSPTGTHWRVADWDVGTTEGGSSGSCLFDDATKRCIGTLSGGYAACTNSLPDWYGRFSRHWTGGGTAATRLSDWLDPFGSGTLFLDGKDLVGVIFADGFERGDTSAWIGSGDVIFADGFETGDTSGWSAAFP